MKKYLITSIIGLLTMTNVVYAVSPSPVGYGGTGTTTPSGILYGDNGATSHLNTVGIGSNLLFGGGVLSANNWSFSTTSISALYPLIWNTTLAQMSSIATSSLNLEVNSFLSPNISQWTNNIGYLTSLSGAASSTLLTDANTWSGVNTFLSTITGSISGNAGTVTNGVYTNTFATLFDNNLAGTSSVASITTLPNLSLPATQLTSFGTPFYTYFSATNTDALTDSTSVTNKYYTNAQVLTYLDTISKGYFFSTSSSAWAFNQHITATTTLPSITTLPGLTSASLLSILASQVSDFTSTVNSYINGSSTIPKTYTANTFTGAQTFSSLFAISASTTNATTSKQWITSLGTPAGAFLAINPNGEVIATTTPTSGGTPGGADTNIQFNNGGVFGGNPYFTWDNVNTRFGVGTSTPFATLSVNGNSLQTAPLFVVASSSAIATTTALIIDSNGKVSIGTTQTRDQLAVKGSFFAGGGTVGLTFSDNTLTTNYAPGVSGSGDIDLNFAPLGLNSNLIFGNNGLTPGVFTERMRIDSAGQLGLATTTPQSLFAIGDGSTGAGGGIMFGLATSSFSTTGGIDLGAGCFALNGTCLTSGAGAGVVLSSVFSTSTPGTNVVISKTGAPGSATTFTAGAPGTLTIPSDAVYVVVELWGGGAGGGGGGQSDGVGGNGGVGSNSCFGTNSNACVGIGSGTIHYAGGGYTGYGGYNGTSGGYGGAADGGDIIIRGGGGQMGLPYVLAISGGPGGAGGSAPRGGGGAPSIAGAGGTGQVFGGGGAGGFYTYGSPALGYGGGGGGGGAYSQKTISSPATTYYYTVGAGGAAGTAGSNAYAGGAGGAGGLAISVYTPTGLSQGSVGSGLTGQMAYFTNTGNALAATSTLFINSASNLGIGTTSPSTIWGVPVKMDIASLGHTFMNLDAPANKATGIFFSSASTPEWMISSRNTADGPNNRLSIWDNSVTERFTIIQGGNVGIGTTSPGVKLHIADTTNFPFKIDSTLTTGNVITFTSNTTAKSYFGLGGSGIITGSTISDSVLRNESGKIMFSNGNTIGMTMDTNGRLGVGSTSPASLLTLDSAGTTMLTISGASTGYINSGIRLMSETGTNVRGSGIFMHDINSATEWFAGRPYNTSDSYIIARKTSAVLDESTAQVANELFAVGSGGQLKIHYLTQTNSGYAVCVDASFNQTISTNNSGCSTSDARLKHGIEYLGDGALATLMKLKPAKYFRNDDGITVFSREKAEEGFIAQDLVDIIPSAAPKGADGFFGFNVEPVVTVVTKALQELAKKVDALFERITENEAISNIDGVILKSKNGFCYRFTVEDNGTLSKVRIASTTPGLSQAEQKALNECR